MSWLIGKMRFSVGTSEFLMNIVRRETLIPIEKLKWPPFRKSRRLIGEFGVTDRKNNLTILGTLGELNNQKLELINREIEMISRKIDMINHRKMDLADIGKLTHVSGGGKSTKMGKGVVESEKIDTIGINRKIELTNREIDVNNRSEKGIDRSEKLT